MKGRIIVSTLLALLLLVSMPVSALAATWDIGKGDITVNAESGGQTVRQGGGAAVPDSAPVITGTSKENTLTINAESGQTASVTLSGVNIDVRDKGKAAVSTTGEGNVSIELNGESTLRSGYEHAGLEKNNGGSLTIADEDKNGKLTAWGEQQGAGIGGGSGKDGSNIFITGGGVNAIGGGLGGNGSNITISGGKVGATNGLNGAGIGGGQHGSGSNITISGGEVNATGGVGSAGIGGGYDAENDDDGTGNQITIKSNESGAPTVNATGGESSIDEETEEKIPGGAGIGSGVGDAKANITLEGKVTIVAKAGEGNAAIGDMNGEQVFTGLDGSITRYDSEGNDTTLPTDPGYPVPAVPSSSGGGSADASVQESVFPGLVVTDKDGQRISYTSIRGNNVLSIRVGRFTASLRASLATLRQLRAEGIDTITFQTILCSTTLSVDELLAMGGEDTEVVLTHHIRSSTLTVGGKAV